MIHRSALILLAAGAACAAAPSPPDADPVSQSDGRYVMGTVLEISVRAADAEAARAALDASFALAERLDGLFSVYVDDSDVSRLNRSVGSQPIDPETGALLKRALEYARQSGGAFDVTVGPLVRLWMRAAESGVLPSEADLEAARALVGPEQLILEAPDRAALRRPGVSVDLGGIAKGWALDRMLPGLRERGIESALLNFGQSSTWALGVPPGEAGWRLLARAPDGGFLGVLTLRDRALSVSGSLGQFVEIEGRRYGHVLDPRSGLPLTSRRQALVVARDASHAEALSKALLVLGEVEGIALVEAQEGCEALLVDADGRAWSTVGWASAVSWVPESGPR